MRSLCNELITQGMQLTDAVNHYHEGQGPSPYAATGLKSVDELQALRSSFSPNRQHIKTADDLSMAPSSSSPFPSGGYPPSTAN